MYLAVPACAPHSQCRLAGARLADDDGKVKRVQVGGEESGVRAASGEESGQQSGRSMATDMDVPLACGYAWLWWRKRDPSSRFPARSLRLAPLIPAPRCSGLSLPKGYCRLRLPALDASALPHPRARQQQQRQPLRKQTVHLHFLRHEDRARLELTGLSDAEAEKQMKRFWKTVGVETRPEGNALIRSLAIPPPDQA